MVTVHCPLCCDQPFEDQQALFFHLRGLRNNLYCPICSDKFPTLELLVTHLSRTCNGPVSPSEAKRRCVSTTSLHDQSDIEDEANKNQNQISKTQADTPKPHPQIAIPGVLLKNVSISIKGNKSEETPVRKPVKPVVVAVDPRNPKITNGLPLHPAFKGVELISSLDKTSHPSPQTDKHSTNITNSTQIVESETAQPQVRKRGRPRKYFNNNKTPMNGTLEKSAERKQDGPKKLLLDGELTGNCKQKEGVGQVLDINKLLPIDKPNKIRSQSLLKSTLGSTKPTVDNNSVNSNLPLCDNSEKFNNTLEGRVSHSAESQENNSTHVDLSIKDAAVKVNQEKAPEDASKVESEDEYTCSACNVRFISIYEHIKEYHYGQEVVVEVPENEIKEDLKAYQNEKSTPLDEGSSSEEKEDFILEDKDDVPIVTYEETTRLEPDNDVQQDETMFTQGETCGSQLVLSKNFYLGSVDIYKKHPLLVKQINRLRKSKPGDWLRIQGYKRGCYHFITDADKMLKLISEFKGNCTQHPVFKVPMKELFENPKINVVAITNKPNTPIFTSKVVDLNVPIPMYIVERKESNPDGYLGGIASYVITSPISDSCDDDLFEEAKVIAVMNVVLGSDESLTIENLVFKNKPGIESIIPVLEDISDPEIPLLNGGKLLKWMCKKCMAVTWKFPLNKEIHVCNGCLICHKPFATRIALQKHLALHKKNSSAYCEKCHLAFATSKLLENHQAEHENHILCPLCKLFIPLYQQAAHTKLHSNLPVNQFPCSVCHKVFSSMEEIKAHEVRTCGRLVAKYNCDECDKKFFSLTSLSYHSSDHKFVTIKFPCRFCTKTFIKEKEQCPRKAGKRKPSSYLQKIWHERIHTRDRPFLCSACPKRFRSLNHQIIHSRQAHTTSKHKDVPIHMCSFCDKVFMSEHRLEVHKNKFHLV